MYISKTTYTPYLKCALKVVDTTPLQKKNISNMHTNSCAVCEDAVKPFVYTRIIVLNQVNLLTAKVQA